MVLDGKSSEIYTKPLDYWSNPLLTLPSRTIRDNGALYLGPRITKELNWQFGIDYVKVTLEVRRNSRQVLPKPYKLHDPVCRSVTIPPVARRLFQWPVGTALSIVIDKKNKRLVLHKPHNAWPRIVLGEV